MKIPYSECYDGIDDVYNNVQRCLASFCSPGNTSLTTTTYELYKPKSIIQRYIIADIIEDYKIRLKKRYNVVIDYSFEEFFDLVFVGVKVSKG